MISTGRHDERHVVPKRDGGMLGSHRSGDGHAASPQEKRLPVSQVRRYLEPGPIVLVSSRWQGKTNIMTMGWHTVMEFTPSLVGCIIASGNHSFQMVRGSRECVINIPTTSLTDQVVGIGNTSGADIDKFAHFGLTTGEPETVQAPLINECHACLECRLHDDSLRAL